MQQKVRIKSYIIKNNLCKTVTTKTILCRITMGKSKINIKSNFVKCSNEDKMLLASLPRLYNANTLQLNFCPTMVLYSKKKRSSQFYQAQLCLS